VGGTCSTHGGEERCLQSFGWEAQRRDHWEDLGVGGGEHQDGPQGDRHR